MKWCSFPPSDYPHQVLPPKAVVSCVVVESRSSLAFEEAPKRPKNNYFKGWGFHGYGRTHYQLRIALERQEILRANGQLCQYRKCTQPKDTQHGENQ